MERDHVTDLAFVVDDEHFGTAHELTLGASSAWS
jgi:hypothetical protein